MLDCRLHLVVKNITKKSFELIRQHARKYQLYEEPHLA
jgi:hypothetical protein